MTRLGHFEGDLVLARVGRLLEQKSRQSNVSHVTAETSSVILMPETRARSRRRCSPNVAPVDCHRDPS